MSVPGEVNLVMVAAWMSAWLSACPTTQARLSAVRTAANGYRRDKLGICATLTRLGEARQFGN